MLSAREAVCTVPTGVPSTWRSFSRQRKSAVYSTWPIVSTLKETKKPFAERPLTGRVCTGMGGCEGLFHGHVGFFMNFHISDWTAGFPSARTMSASLHLA